MTPMLLDASVWLASRDADDDNHAPALQLVDAGAQNRLAALDLTIYEVANVAVTKWRSPERARVAVRLVREACSDQLVRVDDEIVDHAISIAAEHRLSVYDAAYVAAAKLRGWTLVSGDERDLVQPGHAVGVADAAG